MHEIKRFHVSGLSAMTMLQQYLAHVACQTVHLMLRFIESGLNICETNTNVSSGVVLI